MRYVALLLTAGLMAQAQQLNLVIVEGEGAINNIRQRTAREPIVEVQDDNHRPVAGVVVVFTLPNQGAGGEFSGGAHSLTVITDDQGRAVARGFRPNGVRGQYQIRVNASYNGRTGSTTINQSNVPGAGAGAAAAGAGHGKLIAILAVVGGAAAAGAAIAATRSGGNNNSSTIPAGPSATTITAGSTTVGAPH
jgi:hypothetical protein